MDTQKELNSILTIASREFKDYIKSRRLILVGVLYAVMALAIIGITLMSYNYSKSMGMAGDFKPVQVLGMMDILNIILVLLAIILTADTISAEKKDRTIYQLLSKPVERSTVVMGKFLGCLGVIIFFFVSSSIIAYAITVVFTGIYPSPGDLMGALEVIAFMAILFAVYVALGILISTVTKNPLISILAGIIVWIALFFSNTIGNMIGSLSLMDEGMIVFGDPFSRYPLFAKAMVWIDPISHDIVSPLLSGGVDKVGMPLWANTVFLLAYTGIILFAAIELFNRQDV
ncbi:ABC-type transport system involved in multi-copper enzyme maturation, permease component [Methanocella conradii HZ254]|uniref:ABC-type transport system involved in multi-copper enzyme maturation, permease component n=1 Tax=Methanocella conradii (strain DSM 24694 / JCM 17849 / CGMCC 1.5162 / HZ254) TaxID=1041930 RepID=H8I780_METCZ|nr:ABC transporter permease [Methanocella conradii]AFD00331.1 ABC-type transport system involved in multi-copper enzyme maturation, permease component [Methanocella conradii HZ254]